MKLSVVINTINRPQELKSCLQALSKQSDTNFEVIVIDQSSDDSTEQIVSDYRIKYFRSRSRNLSVSRNMGIVQSSGEIIAFIDDDAIAIPRWVELIKNNFRAEDCDILAGRVENHSDPKYIGLQFQNGIVSHYGNILDIRDVDEKTFNKGYEGWYNRPMGTNMAFSKKALLRVGGFDEYYEYIHDETDISLRMIQAGAKFIYDDNLLVKHYPAKSHNRRHRYLLNWRVETKNNLYFGLKNGQNHILIRLPRAFYRILNPKGPFVATLNLLKSRKLSFGEYLKQQLLINLGIWQGLLAGLLERRRLLRSVSTYNQFLTFNKK